MRGYCITGGDRCNAGLSGLRSRTGQAYFSPARQGARGGTAAAPRRGPESAALQRSLAIALIAVLVAAPGEATVMLPADLGDLSREAYAIARGRVARVDVRWTTEDRRAGRRSGAGHAPIVITKDSVQPPHPGLVGARLILGQRFGECDRAQLLLVELDADRCDELRGFLKGALAIFEPGTHRFNSTALPEHLGRIIRRLHPVNAKEVILELRNRFAFSVWYD